MKKHIFYITYTPKVEYNGTIPTDPKQFKDLVESIWDTDGKKIVEKLLVRNIDTKVDFRGIYYNKKFKFIGIVQLPTKNADIEHYKDYMTLYTLSGTGGGTSADLTSLNTAIEALKKELADLKAKGLQGSITEDKVKELINNSTIETTKVIESLKKDNSTEITKLLQEILNNKETIKETIKNIAEIQKLEREFNQKLTETNNKVTTLESKTTTLETKTRELETKANGILSKEELLKLLGDAKVKNSDNLGGIPSNGFIRNYMNNSLTAQDLNSIDYPGFFSQKDKTKALVAKNYPKDNLIGILFVGNSVNPQQVYFANETNEIYVRSKTAGDWTAWTKTSLDFNSIKPEIEALITEKVKNLNVDLSDYVKKTDAEIIAVKEATANNVANTLVKRDSLQGIKVFSILAEKVEITKVPTPIAFFNAETASICTLNIEKHIEPINLKNVFGLYNKWIIKEVNSTNEFGISLSPFNVNYQITFNTTPSSITLNVFDSKIGLSGMLYLKNCKENINDLSKYKWINGFPEDIKDEEFITYMTLPNNEILLARVY